MDSVFLQLKNSSFYFKSKTAFKQETGIKLMLTELLLSCCPTNE